MKVKTRIWAPVLLLAPALTLIALPVAGQDADQDKVFRADVEVVNVVCTVLGRGDRYVTTLTQDDFRVLEDGVEQEIRFFNFEQGDESQPLNIVLLVDTSGSVKDKLAFEQEAASIFFRETLRENKDLAAVVQFDSEINLLQDFTYQMADLQRSLHGIRPGGATKLYDAIFVASEDLLRHEVGRRVLVVLSDGDDTQSSVDDDEAIRVAQENDVVIFGVGVRGGGGGADFGTLKRFARATGGSFFNSRVRLDELAEAFEAINAAIKNQYSLGYISSNQRRDGGYREIEVKMNRGGLKVNHRRGYFAPKPGS